MSSQLQPWQERPAETCKCLIQQLQVCSCWWWEFETDSPRWTFDSCACCSLQPGTFRCIAENLVVWYRAFLSMEEPTCALESSSPRDSDEHCLTWSQVTVPQGLQSMTHNKIWLCLQTLVKEVYTAARMHTLNLTSGQLPTTKHPPGCVPFPLTVSSPPP